jgi:hypothetical protein
VIALVWEFEVVTGKSDEFERFYGADGDWTKLSRRSRSFLGSSFLRDIAAQNRYIVVEYWGEMVVYERHLANLGDRLKALEHRRDQFVARIHPMGVFTALDVPDRVGPTWSRRSSG